MKDNHELYAVYVEKCEAKDIEPLTYAEWLIKRKQSLNLQNGRPPERGKP